LTRDNGLARDIQFVCLARPPSARYFSLTSTPAAPPTSATTSSPTSTPSDAPTYSEDAPDLKPPYTPLDFRIPDHIFRAARLADPESAGSFWSYGMYRGPPTKEQPNGREIRVHYCRSIQSTERILQKYFVGERLLGFDMEWAMDAMRFHGARKNVSLIQLSSPSAIALFHVAVFPGAPYLSAADSVTAAARGADTGAILAAPTLRAILEDPTITKAGVAIKADCTRLLKWLAIDTKGIFELSHLYKLVKYFPTGEHKLINRICVSLATQVLEHLGLPLYKGPEVRESDWSQILTEKQIFCKYWHQLAPVIFLPRRAHKGSAACSML